MILKDILRPIYRYMIYLKSIYKFYRIKNKRCSRNVLNSIETVRYIKNNRCSVSRFGDGELSLVLKGEFGDKFHSNFQSFNPELSKRLSYILSYKEPAPNHIVGLPACGFSFGTSKFKWNIAEYWNRYMFSYIDKILKISKSEYTYCDTNFTRFYMDYSDSSWCNDYVEQLKEIWKGRNIIFIEGATTRLGAGNDLFMTAKSIRRILCPPKNAIERYDAIMTAIRQNAKKDDLLIIALGMTATIMAYDLANEGFQALDLGHIDIEYEWYRMGAKDKVAIKGKYTNESANGRIAIADGSDEYKLQVVATVF